MQAAGTIVTRCNMSANKAATSLFGRKSPIEAAMMVMKKELEQMQSMLEQVREVQPLTHYCAALPQRAAL